MNENSLGLFNPVDKICHKISKWPRLLLLFCTVCDEMRCNNIKNLSQNMLPGEVCLLLFRMFIPIQTHF